MARKSKKKREEEFIDASLKLSAMIAFLITWWITGSLTTSVFVAITVLVIVVGIFVIRAIQANERLKKSCIHDIDKMDGRQFELYLGHLFKSYGYDVKVTNEAGDYGADVVISKEGRKIVVQAKRYSKNVGIKAVQEAQASIAHYGAHEAWVVSNSDYTEAAYNLAKSNKVKLLNREALVEMILNMNPGSAPNSKQMMASTPSNFGMCEKSGGKMVRRVSSKGEFLGCSNFPKCWNKRAV